MNLKYRAISSGFKKRPKPVEVKKRIKLETFIAVDDKKLDCKIQRFTSKKDVREVNGYFGQVEFVGGDTTTYDMTLECEGKDIAEYLELTGKLIAFQENQKSLLRLLVVHLSVESNFSEKIIVQLTGILS